MSRSTTAIIPTSSSDSSYERHWLCDVADFCGRFLQAVSFYVLNEPFLLGVPFRSFGERRARSAMLFAICSGRAR
jgi:hypothetical protein